MATYPLSLFIFRRDLRLQDNTALNAALRLSDKVIVCFILDPRQASSHPFHSAQALRFMLESLEDLAEELRHRGGRLYVFSGEAEDVVARLLNQVPVRAVFCNRDYTPFSGTRDLALGRLAEAKGVNYHSFDDVLLHAPGDVLKGQGGPYTIFTPFFKKAATIDVPRPSFLTEGCFYTDPVPGDSPDVLKEASSQGLGRVTCPGGRSSALAILKTVKRFRDYARTRDIPSEDATTHLSAHLKFGTVSVREVYQLFRKELGLGHPLIRQLFWRDFFTTIMHHFPHVLGHSFYEEYDTIRWANRQDLFQAWCEGRTGFPIVDAGMRQLNATGFMHNRVRMIAASFLVKDLHVDWRWGEKYFAQKLVDYDPALNNGNWQWAASTGCDHQPYFRIFNPWLQQKRFDPRAVYIQRWVEELASASPQEIHGLQSVRKDFSGYPAPVISHADAVIWSKDAFREASRRGKKY